jgi:hypothetical protein
MSHHIVWAKELVSVVYSGQCSEADVLDVVIKLQSDHRFDAICRALHDFRRCAGMAPSPAALEELAARNSAAAASNSRLRIAVIAERADVLAMLERFASIGLSPYDLRTFEDAESANAWLADSPPCIQVRRDLSRDS